MKQLALVTVTLTLHSCSRAAPQAGSRTVDSAGVTVVTNTSAAWGPEAQWRVAPTPSVTIGTAGGAPEYQLYRVVNAMRLADGRIAVANRGSHEIRFYDVDGTFLATAGREGAGPGEFTSMGLLWRSRDSLLVFDLNAGMRISVFTQDGTFARSFMLERTPSGQIAVPLDVFANGFVLAEIAPFDRQLVDGYALDTVLLVRYTPEGRLADSLGLFPDGERYLRKGGDRVASTPRPFGLRAQRAIAGDRMYYGSSASYEIGLYGLDGALERVIRAAIPNPPVTDAERAEHERRVSEGRARRAPVYRALYEQIEIAATKPAYGRLLVDADDNLWVADYARVREELNHWNVFDASGRWLGPVDTPEGMIVFEVGRDYVLGLWKDDFDVEYVRVHELVKEDPGHGAANEIGT